MGRIFYMKLSLGRQGRDCFFLLFLFCYKCCFSAQTEKTHAIVKVEDSANTTLEIRSKNNVGESVEKSIVVIPKRSDIVTANLQSFTQWSNASGITYLAWQSPVNTTEGFVVFACQDWNQQTQLCNVSKTVLFLSYMAAHKLDISGTTGND